jgi:uncharacterized protein (DUF433 family)
MDSMSFSPREAAAVSGAPLAAIQKAITKRKIPALGAGPGGRQIDQTALLAFALAEALPAEMRLAPGVAYRLLHDAEMANGIGELAFGDLVRIDARKALAGVRRRLDLYERAKLLIVRDPAIMGGAPTIRGTRITAQSILGRIEDGDSIECILEDYPYLDPETVDAAALYARANPPRGRPSGRLWRRAS